MFSRAGRKGTTPVGPPMIIEVRIQPLRFV
jgi:hypothetical protein